MRAHPFLDAIFSLSLPNPPTHPLRRAVPATRQRGDAAENGCMHLFMDAAVPERGEASRGEEDAVKDEILGGQKATPEAHGANPLDL